MYRLPRPAKWSAASWVTWVPSVVAMEITGHRTRSVFDRYNITTANEAREA